jgi:CheY-like chemotaxis protein
LLIAAPDSDTRSRYRELFDGTWDVTDAKDGRDALVQALIQPPVLFLGAARLPFIGGEDLCRLFRRDRQTRDTRIILMTNDSAPQRHDRARKAGADVVLVEPIEPEALRTEANRLCAARPEGSDGACRADVPAPMTTTAGSAIERHKRHRRKSRSFSRFATTSPPLAPFAVLCPVCDRPLRYQHSFLGGVNRSQAEQWDNFVCLSCRGAFEFRHRTRRVRPQST